MYYESEGSVYGNSGYPDPNAFGGPPNHQHRAHAPDQALALSQSFHAPEPQPHLGGYRPAQPQAFIPHPLPLPVQAPAAYPPYVFAPDPSASDSSALDPSASIPPLPAPTVSDFDLQDPALVARLCDFAVSRPLDIHLIHTNQAGDHVFATLRSVLCEMDAPGRPSASRATCILVAKRLYRRVQRFCARWYRSWHPDHPPPTVLREDLVEHVHRIQEEARTRRAPNYMPWKDAVVTAMGGAPPLWGYPINPASKDKKETISWTEESPVPEEELESGQSSGAAGKGKEVMRPYGETRSQIAAPPANVAAPGSFSAQDFSQTPPHTSTNAPASSASDVQGPPGLTYAQQSVVSVQQNIQNNTVVHAHASHPSNLPHSYSAYSLPDRRSIQDSVAARSLSHSQSLPSGFLPGGSVPSLSSGLGNLIPGAEPTNSTPSAEHTVESPQELVSTSRYLSVLVTESSKSVDSGTLPKEVHSDHLRISFQHLQAVTLRLGPPPARHPASAPSGPHPASAPSGPHPASAPSGPHPASAPSARRSSSSSSGIIPTPSHSSSSSGHSAYRNQLTAPGAGRLEHGYEQAGASLQDVDMLQGSNAHEPYGNGYAHRFPGNIGSDARQNSQGFGPTQ